MPGISRFLAVAALAGLSVPAVLGLGAPAATAAANGSLTATFQKTSDWRSGYVANYNIVNGGAPTTSWMLTFQLPSTETVTSSWSGDLSHVGTTYTVTNTSWNGALATGGTATFGFQTTYTGAFVAPTQCTLNRQPCSGPTGGTGSGGTGSGGTGSGGTGSGGTGTPVPSPITATFAKTSDWGSGFVGSYPLINTGAPITSWSLKFSLPASESITSAWSGDLANSSTSYTLTNAEWNGSLATGGTATVGFQGTYSGTFVPPTSCTINGGACSATTGTGTPTNTGNFSFAPYVDATVDTPPFDLVNAMQASGTKDFTLGFVVSQGNTCEASWGSFYPVNTDYYAAGIAALRKAGGDVIVSFGGEASTELADTCTSVAALQAQYQSVITTYGLTHIDFDIEGADEGNTASLARRGAAIVGLERANPTLTVSLTLPVLPTGLEFNGLNVLNSTIGAGARVDLVNMMAMDYGGAAPNPSGQIGAYAIEAAKATEAQLAKILPSDTAAQLWKMVGVTPMLGVNDNTDEIFGVNDAQQLETFASQVGMGRLSMWAATRDVSCPGGAQGFASDTCSGITQQPFAFSTVFAAYDG